MPHIGLIRGVGEGYLATGYIIKIIRALNRRFRSKITFEEMKVGDCARYGYRLTDGAVLRLRECDAVFSGDITSKSNPIDYSVEDIALALDACVEYNIIRGLEKHSDVDVCIASYFDGGSRLRHGEETPDGCSETRICSTYTAMQIVKYVTRECENRRRRLAFVSDADNEYCAKLFLRKLLDFTLPISNFRVTDFEAENMTFEMLFNPSQFDTVFASKAFSDHARGLYKYVLGEDFASYRRYGKSKSLYYVKGMYFNATSATEVPSICSYIFAFSDMLKREFNMHKESEHILLALDMVIKSGISAFETDKFVNEFIEEMNMPSERRHNKPLQKKIYVK